MLPDTFHTARLKLRLIVPEDAGPIFDRYAQDTTVTRFVIWRPHRSRSDTEAYIAQCIATPPDVSRTYVLTDRTDGDVRGAFALRLAAPHRLDCGYVLARAWWGRGLMTEVLTRSSELGFVPASYLPYRRCVRRREHRLRARDGKGWFSP
jgi:ribosomal-protein-alanine N-acetyltransferase